MSQTRENTDTTTITVARRQRKELGLMKRGGETFADVVDRLLDDHDDAPRNRDDPLATGTGGDRQ